MIKIDESGELVGSELCRVEVIARLFGDKSVRRVQQLTQDGVIETVEALDEKGKKCRRYDLVPTVQRYVRHLLEKSKGKQRTYKEVELKEQKLEAEIALKESQGELHRLKTQIAAGEYISIDEVRLDYAKFFLVFKKFAMSIPARISGMLSGQLEPLEVRRIEKEISGELADLLSSFVIAGVAKPKEVKEILNASKDKEVAEKISS